jgi:hypothetical protein
MINSKWTRTSSKIICNEKKALWTQTTFHYKPRFGTMRTSTRTPGNLDLYLVVDHRHMKAIDANYSVRVGYWASKNNMQEYKVYVIVIWIFDSVFVNNLWQAPRNNLWLAKSTNRNYKTHLLHPAEQQNIPIVIGRSVK